MYRFSRNTNISKSKQLNISAAIDDDTLAKSCARGLKKNCILSFYEFINTLVEVAIEF
jgi:hypothetical protein